MEKSKQIGMRNGGRCGSGGQNSKSNDFIDHSKAKILLCDSDSESCEEVSALLRKCHYHVMSVSSPIEVINACCAELPYIDIILVAVDLPPIDNGIKMLKYIMHYKEFQHIPIIMLSTQNEPSLIHKCLKLGAADYLVKPLCNNKLLDLWRHIWKRQQMPKLKSEFDLVASNPSEANRRSAIMLEDTGDNFSRSAIPETSSNYQQIKAKLTQNKASQLGDILFDQL